MSNLAPTRARFVVGERNFAIVASRYNGAYVESLVQRAAEQLRKDAPSAVLTVHRVPGAFEIPVIVREIALQEKTHVIIAMGVIIEGETNHAEHLARSVTDALQRIATEHGVPVINVVLSMKNEAQARERCLEEKMNRGTEAARTAIEIANTLSELRGEKIAHG